MTISRRVAIAALVFSLLVAPMNGTLFAATDEVPSPPAPVHLTLQGRPLIAIASGLDTDAPPYDVTYDAARFEQPIYVGRPPHHHNEGAAAAIFLGAAGAIAGTAVLVYANRPECGVNPYAGGCGYGTKVTGGAVLAAGVVGLVVGAALWR
jgi:hypothetical protein